MITVESCELDELVIDDGIVSSSFVVRFGLLCDDFYIRGIFSALIMVGMLLGSYPAGYISGLISQLHLSIRFLSGAKLLRTKILHFCYNFKTFCICRLFWTKKGTWRLDIRAMDLWNHKCIYSAQGRVHYLQVGFELNLKVLKFSHYLSGS